MTALLDPPVTQPARPNRRRRRRIRVVGFAALASGIAFALLAVHLFVFPGEDPLPAHADVAEVLGPPLPQRIATAYHLLDEGVVDSVLISVSADPMDPSKADPRWLAWCAAQAHTVCFLAKPYTTQGEARKLGAEAKAHHWTSAIVITQTAHLTRARLIVGRCFSGRITMRASGEPPSGGWLYEIAYQTAASLKALLVTNTC